MDMLVQIRDSLISDLSSWGVDAPKKDVFMIGNGRVSAVLGWGESLTELGWVLGPYYETDFNRAEQQTSTYFGTQTARLLDGLKEVQWTQQRLGRARQTDVMVCRLQNPGTLQWDTIDYCSLKKDVINRIMIFKNCRMEPSPAYTLEVEWKKPEEHGKIWSPDFIVSEGSRTGDKQLEIVLKDAGGHTRSLFTSLNVPCDISKNRITLSIPALKPGEHHVVIQSMTISVKEKDGLIYETPTSEETAMDLKDTLEHWKNWSDSGAAVHSSEPWFDDLVDAAKVWCKVQQSIHGVFTPMIFYSDAYVRDCNGPVRLFLRLGMFQEVREVLDFFRKAAVLNRQQQANEHYSGVNNVRLDVDAFPESTELDWNQVDPGKAEIPSLIILWHWWYYQQTGELAPVRKNWGFLIRCLESQKATGQGFIRFHGDETYKYLGDRGLTGVDQPLYIDLFDTQEDIYGSFESTLLFLQAFEAMKKLAGELGETDALKPIEPVAERMGALLEDAFWDSADGCYRMACGGESGQLGNPHTIVLSTSSWLDAFTYRKVPLLDAGRNRASWEKCLDFLDTHGWVNAAPYLPVTDGHLPGFMLCGASLYKASAITHILDQIKAIATPAGGFAELYTQFDAEGARGYHGKAWGRLRPWESGINVESMLFALTGFRFDADNGVLLVSPRLPEGWTSFEIKGYRCCGTAVNLQVRRAGELVKWCMENEGNVTIKVKLEASREEFIELQSGQAYQGEIFC